MTKKTGVSKNVVSSPKLDFLNVAQAAEVLGLSIGTIRKGANAGEIPCRRVGRRYVFSVVALQNWAACNSTESAD